MSKLTIYSQSGHLIQQFPAETKIVTLPKSVEIESIVAIDINGQIIPFSYLSPTSIGTSLTDRQTGEKVDVTVIKDDSNIKGKIINQDSNSITLLTASGITIVREYDQLIVNLNSADQDVTRPRLNLESSQPFTISYLISNIAWTCIGTILVDHESNQMYLRLAGNITNNTETDISAMTTLVSGEVYQNRPHQDVHRAAKVFMATPSPMVSQQVETNLVEDYIKYEVGERLIQNKTIVELGTSVYPINKIYIHQTNKRDRVSWGYRFRATGFIPSCSVNVYSIDTNRTIDAYLGSNDIRESQTDDEIDIVLGESTMLQCKSSVVISDVKDEAILKQYKLPTEEQIDGVARSWHIITEELTVEITNHNPNSAILVLKHPVDNNPILNVECQAFKQRKDGFIEWYFEIPSKFENQPRKETFKCKIVTAKFL